MKIKEENKQSIISELEFSIQKMKEEQNPKTKLYFFSAVYGILQRIFNIDYDPDLVFAHFVINQVYNNIAAAHMNPDPIIKLPEDLFERLTVVTGDFLEAIKKDENLYEVLKKYSLIGYVALGNGYYLYQKGLLKI